MSQLALPLDDIEIIDEYVLVYSYMIDEYHSLYPWMITEIMHGKYKRI